MQKIFLFAIGIGGNTNERELRGIATDEENFMFKVDGYSALDGIKNLLAIRTCRGKCKIIICTTHERGPYAVCGSRRRRSAYANAQADMSLRCPLTESMGTVVYFEEQKMSRPDIWTFAVRIWHKGPFSFVHIILKSPSAFFCPIFNYLGVSCC